MKNLKFSALAQNALNERKMNSLAGGLGCGCACSSNCSIDNGNANNAGNLHSPGSMTSNNHMLDTVTVNP